VFSGYSICPIRSPLKKKQEKGEQESHKQLNAFPAPKPHPIKGNCVGVCVFVQGVAWKGLRGGGLVLEFLLHKLSFEWLSVTLALLKCSLLSSRSLCSKVPHRPLQILAGPTPAPFPPPQPLAGWLSWDWLYSVHPSEQTAIKPHHFRTPNFPLLHLVSVLGA